MNEKVRGLLEIKDWNNEDEKEAVNWWRFADTVLCIY